jgi:hypothetical protein
MSVSVIQYAYGSECLQMVALTSRVIMQGCSKYEYKYSCYFNPPCLHPYWEKPFLIKKELENGHEWVVWLDTDCLWLGNEELNVPIDNFGMTFHHLCSHQTMMDHYNAGMIIVRNNEKSLELVNEWIHCPDEGHQWHDQYSLNKVLKTHTNCVRNLDHKYNSVQGIPDYSSSNPVIVSWHGQPNRVDKIRQYIQDNKL